MQKHVACQSDQNIITVVDASRPGNQWRQLARSGGKCPEIDATSDCYGKHRFGIRRAFLMLSQAGKGTASGEETKGAVSERVSSNGGRATEALREHCSAVGGAGRSSAVVVQMARSIGPS